MENFSMNIPTAVYFGKNQLENLKELVGPQNSPVLLVYGGGSILKSGLYDRIKENLEDVEVYEMGGVQANPDIDRIREASALCKEKKIRAILAAGGGSVLDSCKAISAGALYEGDPWDFFDKGVMVQEALPVISIATMAASGSELASGAVVSNRQTKEKKGYDSPLFYPKAVILEPENTFTVPARQTAAGIIDMLSHLMEQYFTWGPTYLSDQLIEGCMRAVIENGPKAIADPKNADARGQLLWASELANSGMLCNGAGLNAFSVHALEHALSAFYEVPHGIGLAILSPAWMRYVLSDQTAERFAHFARTIWQVEEEDDWKAAEKGIDQMEQFFRSLGAQTRLSELREKVDSGNFDQMAEHAMAEGLEYAWIPLTKEDARTIYEKAM